MRNSVARRRRSSVVERQQEGERRLSTVARMYLQDGKKEAAMHEPRMSMSLESHSI